MVKVISEPKKDDEYKTTYINHNKKTGTNKTINNINKSVIIYSTNGAGAVNGKAESLKSQVLATNANIVTIQETHCVRKGRIKMPQGFVIFEAIQKEKHGVTMCAIREELEPKLIEEYHDPFELLVVECKVNSKNIRIITGCGPQENWEESKRR